MYKIVLSIPSIFSKGRCWLVVRFCCLLGILSLALWGAPRHDIPLHAADDGTGRRTILVQFTPDALPGERMHVLQEVGAELVNWLAPIRVAEVTLPEQAVERLATHGAVQFAELDSALVQGTYLPNDPALQDSSKTYAPNTLELAGAWDFTTGDENVLIAVLDTGINRQHVEFAGRVLPGYDFINDDADPADDHGHGTHVAGTIAAAIDNGHGGAGVCPECRLLPVKVLDENNLGAWSTVAEGLLYAAEQGADIINLSLGGPQQSQTLTEAIRYVQEQGVLVVAAAGNAGGSSPFYPAALDDVLAVGATNEDDEIWYLSNTGVYVDVVAPGYMVYSTSINGDTPNNGYSYMTGTSMAAPHVSGLAGLLLSQDLTRTAAELARAIAESTLDLGEPGWDPIFGFGRIHARAALAGEVPTAPPGTIPPAPLPDEEDEREPDDQNPTDEEGGADDAPDNDGSGTLPGIPEGVRLYVPIAARN